MHVVRTFRAVVAALLGLAILQGGSTRVAGAVLDAFAGTCTASVSISFATAVGTTPTSTAASVTTPSPGSCALVTQTGLTTSAFVVSGSLTTPASSMTCAVGAMTGVLRFTILNKSHSVTVLAVNTGGVIAASGSSGNFSAVGDFSRGVGCPSNGTWTATFVVEDPTVDGV